jgi:acyl carrier protein
MFLERLPLTGSNKLDRSKLPPPADWTTEGATDDSDPVATEALDSIREIVSEIFCKTLSRSTVGPERNFFSLGGNSLMATRIVAQIRKAFAIEFSMKGFFDMPTIDGVSRAIESLLEKEFE